jgi:hypothetical protein
MRVLRDLARLRLAVIPGMIRTGHCHAASSRLRRANHSCLIEDELKSRGTALTTPGYQNFWMTRAFSSSEIGRFDTQVSTQMTNRFGSSIMPVQGAVMKVSPCGACTGLKWESGCSPRL